MDDQLPNLDAWLRFKLRRLSLQWKGRSLALKRARVDRGLYKCAQCQNIFPHKEIQLDHILPVVDLNGAVKRTDGSNRIDWNVYLDRLFVPPEGFQVMCLHDHEVKTMLEGNYRKLAKLKKKNDRKNKATPKRTKL